MNDIVYIRDPSLSEMCLTHNLLISSSFKFQQIWVAPRKMKCVSPAFDQSGERVKHLFVSDNGVDFVLVGNFTYSHLPSISSISLQYAYLFVSTVVSIVGSGFSDKTTCSIISPDNKQIHIESNNVNESQIDCGVPSLFIRTPGTHCVYVSNNGIQFESSSSTTTIKPEENFPSANNTQIHHFSKQSSNCAFTFEAISPPYITSVFPSSGIISHVINIEIRGNGLHRLPFSCFLQNDEFQVKGQFVFSNDTMAVCIITCPSLKDTSSLYSLRIDGSFNDTSHSFLFWCDPPAMVKKLSPSVVTLGDEGSFVVRGKNFRPRPNLSCSYLSPFGEQVTRATFVDESKIKCPFVCTNDMAYDVQLDLITHSYDVSVEKCPKFNIPQKVSVEVSNNGNYYERGSISFEIVAPYSIHNVTPNTIYAGDIMIITGSNFVVRGKLSCTISGIPTKSIHVIDQNNIQISTSINMPTLSDLTFELILDGQIMSVYRSQNKIMGHPKIVNMIPSSALRHFGEEKVIIELTPPLLGETSKYVNTIECRFGTELRSQAKFLSPSMVECRAPPSLQIGEIIFQLILGTTVVRSKFLYMGKPYLLYFILFYFILF